MNRQIFIVNAHVVDETGKFTILDGYPKTFDSKHYGNDLDRTERVALSDAHNLLGDMYTKGTRQIQHVKVETVDGFEVYSQTIGKLAEIPDQA